MIVTWDKSHSMGVVLSEDKLTATYSGSADNKIRASHGHRGTGKYYWEIIVNSGSAVSLGVIDESVNFTTTGNIALNAMSRGFYPYGKIKLPESTVYGEAGSSNGTVFSILMDLDIGTLEFWKNGTSMGVSHTNLKLLTGNIYAYISTGNAGTNNITANFGETAFKYNKPENYSGYNEIYINKSLILNNSKYQKWNERKLPTQGISFLPPFNNSITDGMIASSNGNSGTNYAYKALDKDNNTSWISNTYPTTSSPLWLMIDLSKSTILTGYGISVNTNWNFNTHYFQGSNNGVDFETIHSRVAQPLADTMIYTYFEKVSFRYIRILITQPSVSNGQVSIKELELLDEGIPLQEGYWGIIATTTPNLSQFLEHGMDDTSSLSRKVITLEPVTMIDKSELLNGEIGKVKSAKINLDRYFDIRSIRTDVK